MQPDLTFRRMHIDVHQRGIELDPQPSTGMKAIGKVNIPQEAFIEVLKTS